MRIVEDVFETLELSCPLKGDRIAILDPATFVDVLIFPFRGIARSGFGLHVVPPHVFCASAVRPDIFTCDRTGMTAYTLVQVKDH